ncbi:transporter, major facilitator family protein [Acetobacteraceae bacterium AT-5844]|nr:transporter, major facilitator family protein [Acetobacteraceae bacterium AT-5844]
MYIIASDATSEGQTMPALKTSGTVTLLAVACLTIMVGCVIVPGLPSIARQLGMAEAAGWLVTVPSLGVVLFGPFVGKLIRALGLHRALCVGLFSYGLLGLAGAWLHGPVPVLADRLLLGGATAIVMASGTGLISEFYEGRARLSMMARQGMAIELGGVIFLFIGGLLATVGWQWPFALYLVSWLFLALVLAFVPAVSQVRLDASAPDVAAGSPPVMDIYVAACASMIVFFAGVILLPFRLSAAGLGEAEVGYFLSFVSLVAVGGAAIMPRIVHLIGERRTQALAFAGYAFAHVVFLTAGSTALLIAGGVLLGGGFGLSVPLMNHMVVERSPAHRRGDLLAYLSVAIFLGQFLASFLEFLPGQAASFGAAALVSAAMSLACAAGFGRKAEVAA